MDFHAPVQYVKGVGPQRAGALEKLGIRAAEDLLSRLPMRCEDRRSFARVADLRPGMKVSVAGEIAVAGLRRARRMTLYEVRLDDGSGRLKALWFNQPFLTEVLPRGNRVVLYGAVERDAYGSRQLVMTSPQYEVVEAEDAAGIHTGRIVPIYEKLGPLTGKPLRRVLLHLAEQVPEAIEDPLPAPVRERLGVMGRGAALRSVHLTGDLDLDLLNRFRSPAHLHGPDPEPDRAALPDLPPPARPLPVPGGGPDLDQQGQGARGRPGAARRGGGADRGGDPRAHPGRCRLPSSRPGGGGRAA